MATLNEVLDAARELDSTRVELNNLTDQRRALNDQVDDLTARIQVLQALRDEQKTTLRTLAAALE